MPDSCKSAGEPRETATVGCWDALADMLSLHKVPVILTCVGVFVIQVFINGTQYFFLFKETLPVWSKIDSVGQKLGL